MTKEEKTIIETVSDKGETIKFELFDIIPFEESEYALLLPAEPESKEDENDIVLMKLIEEGDGYTFETIEDDEEFERVSNYIETLSEEEDED